MIHLSSFFSVSDLLPHISSFPFPAATCFCHLLNNHLSLPLSSLLSFSIRLLILPTFLLSFSTPVACSSASSSHWSFSKPLCALSRGRGAVPPHSITPQSAHYRAQTPISCYTVTDRERHEVKERVRERVKESSKERDTILSTFSHVRLLYWKCRFGKCVHVHACVCGLFWLLNSSAFSSLIWTPSHLWNHCKRKTQVYTLLLQLLYLASKSFQVLLPPAFLPGINTIS